MPVTNAAAWPPTKKGTSAPRPAASPSSSARLSSSPRAAAAISSAAAASLEPPASPAPMGMRLPSPNRSAGVQAAWAVEAPGPGLDDPARRPARQRTAAAARSTRLPSTGQSGSSSTIRLSVGRRLRRGGGVERQPVRQADPQEHRGQLVVAIGTPTGHRQRQVDLGPRGARGGVARWAVRRSAAKEAGGGFRAPGGGNGPSAAASASHSSTETVCGRRSGSMPTSSSAASRRA